MSKLPSLLLAGLLFAQLLGAQALAHTPRMAGALDVFDEDQLILAQAPREAQLMPELPTEPSAESPHKTHYNFNVDTQKVQDTWL